MFYVSSVAKKKAIYGWRESYYDAIGITDTDDGIEDILTNKELYKYLSDKKNKVYGTYVYGKNKYEMYVFCTPQKFNVDVSITKLNSLMENHRRKHNPWSEYPIADYLASLKVGVVVSVSYSYSGDGGGFFSSKTTLSKLDSDLWLYNDAENTFDGMKCDSYQAAHFMDVACCASMSYSISAK